MPPPPPSPACTPRHIQRFTELETERAGINTRLAALSAPGDDDPGNPPSWTSSPSCSDYWTTPERLIQQILAAFDIQADYHKKDDQVTIRATITTSIPSVVLAIIADAAELTAQLATSHNPASDYSRAL